MFALLFAPSRLAGVHCDLTGPKTRTLALFDARVLHLVRRGYLNLAEFSQAQILPGSTT